VRQGARRHRRSRERCTTYTGRRWKGESGEKHAAAYYYSTTTTSIGRHRIIIFIIVNYYYCCDTCRPTVGNVGGEEISKLKSRGTSARGVRDTRRRKEKRNRHSRE